MDPSSQHHIHHPFPPTRADIAAAEIDCLEPTLHAQSNQHDAPSIKPTDTAHIKALGRYEVGTPLANYDQKDLVFLPTAVPKYVPAGLLRSSCAEHGLNAAIVLQDMQGGREEVSFVECGLQKTFVVPEKAKKVVVIRTEGGEVVRVVNATAGEGRAPDAEASECEVAVLQPTRVNMPPFALSGEILTPQPTTRRTFDPEAVAFDFTPSTMQVESKPSKLEEPNATVCVDKVQGSHPAPYDSIRSPSRASAERCSFSTTTTANDSEALSQDWLTIGYSSNDCEHCGFVPQAPPSEGESRGASLEVFVQAGQRHDVGWEVRRPWQRSPVRRVCERCAEDQEARKNMRERDMVREKEREWRLAIGL